MSWFNENAPYPAAWLRNLWPGAVVDDRRLELLTAADIPGSGRCHFFAGIGGWEIALDLAGWTGDVWTGSCPCQPFSQAGKRRGTKDERHLWPVWFRLIAERRPPAIFGEQVASALGREWLARVFDDLEGLGYGVAAADLPACSVEAPHRRSRLWFVAVGDPAGDGWRGGRESESPRFESASRRQPYRPNPWAGATWIECADGKARRALADVRPLAHGVQRRAPKLRAYGNAIVPQVAAVFVKSAMESMHNGAR